LVNPAVDNNSPSIGRLRNLILQRERRHSGADLRRDIRVKAKTLADLAAYNEAISILIQASVLWGKRRNA